MVAYFPAIYPGELLYSVLARNAHHTGLPPSKLINDELFGSQSAIPSFDLPFGLFKLAALIPKHNELTVKRLLTQLSLFRYVVAFAKPKVAKQAYHSLLKGRVVDWYVKLGMAAFRVKRVTRLRFCPACNADMMQKHGELYWKREFQLPSVVVCTTHQDTLYNSTIDIKMLSRHAYFAAHSTNCIVRAESRLVHEQINHASMQKLISIADRSVGLIQEDAKYKTHGEWTSYYRRQLEDKGFATSKGRVKQSKLRNAVATFYADIFDNVPDFKVISKLNWLTSITRKHRHAFHPLHHLLLDEFLANQPFELPFGIGPWVCHNPLAGHYGQSVIDAYGVHKNHGHMVAVFECNCGYVYTRWFDVLAGRVGPNRFLKYGPLLTPVLKRFTHKSLSLREIARRIQLDPKTVIKLASEIGIQHTWSMKGLNLKTSHTPVVKPKIKLNRKTVRHSSGFKLDWKQIDNQLQATVRLEVKRIRQISPPIKVTLSAIERGLNKPGWIVRRKQKLPLTARYLDKVVETHADFRIRRLIWAIKRLQKCRLPLYPSHVTRLASIRHDAFDRNHPSLTPYIS